MINCTKCNTRIQENEAFCGCCGAEVELKICPLCNTKYGGNIRYCNKDGTKLIMDSKEETTMYCVQNEDGELLAKKAYAEIDGKASSNVFTQGISGFLGFPFTLIADVAVVGTHYVPMFNSIRSIYNREPVSENIINPLLTNISSEILFDIVADKVLGNIPLVGVYFNVICAKAMTWRLGILFSMLASRGETINPDSIRDAMIVIRKLFPQEDTFKFKQPDLADFIKIVSSVYENSSYEYEEKIRKAKNIFS